MRTVAEKEAVTTDPAQLKFSMLREMFFPAPTVNRAREYSVPLIEEYLHRRVNIQCPDAAEHKNINFPSFSHSKSSLILL